MSTSRSTTAGTFLQVFRPTGAIQTLSSAGAVNISSYKTKITATSGAFTLADGSVIGQLKRIHKTGSAGACEVTPVSYADTNVELNTQGDYVEFLWDGSNWIDIDLGNQADGVTEPDTDV